MIFSDFLFSKNNSRENALRDSRSRIVINYDILSTETILFRRELLFYYNFN